MKKLKLFAGIIKLRAPVCLFALFLIFLINWSIAYPLDRAAKEVEELIVAEKEIAKEKERALVEQFYNEGKRFLEEEDYESAIDQFSRILEIDSEHRGAKRGIKKVRRKLKEKRELETPEGMAKRLLRSGRLKYASNDYDGAIEDFQDALVLDYANKDTIEWLKRTRRRQRLEGIETEERDLLRETEIATKKKEAHEKAAMLEVETAYLPPEKRERRPVEIEELISPVEEEEKARQELLKRLQAKMVPAVSLTEADIRDVIRQFMEVTGVTIIIDEGALAESVGEEPLRITFSTVTPIPLLEVLDIALKATGLGYRVEPNYIWISSPEKLEKEDLVTRTYRLRYGVRRIRKVELKDFETTSGSAE